MSPTTDEIFKDLCRTNPEFACRQARLRAWMQTECDCYPVTVATGRRSTGQFVIEVVHSATCLSRFP